MKASFFVFIATQYTLLQDAVNGVVHSPSLRLTFVLTLNSYVISSLNFTCYTGYVRICLIKLKYFDLIRNSFRMLN